jgi:hypothetical protein
MTDPTTVPAAPALASPAGPDPLAGLRDWHLPDPVSWWPPAPGWWLLGALGLLALSLAVHAALARRRASAPARAALAELARLRAELRAHGDRRRFVAGLSELLRRLALVRYPRDRVAGLCGAEWLAFLDSAGGTGAFSDGPGQVLADGAYRGGETLAELDTDALATLADSWIRAHAIAERGGRSPALATAATADKRLRYSRSTPRASAALAPVPNRGAAR